MHANCTLASSLLNNLLQQLTNSRFQILGQLEDRPEAITQFSSAYWVLRKEAEHLTNKKICP